MAPKVGSQAMVALLGSALLLAGAQESYVVYQAPSIGKGRRLDACPGGEVFSVEVPLNVAKLDFFGDEPPQLDASFSLNGVSTKAYFPDSDGNTHVSHMFMHGDTYNITGCKMPTSAQSDLKAELRTEEQNYMSKLAGSDAGVLSIANDPRPVAVVNLVTAQENPRRRLAEHRQLAWVGNAPATVKVVIILVNVGTTKLSSGTTVDVVKGAVFDATQAGTMATVFQQCSRAKITISGVVKGPITISATSDLFQISSLTSQQLGSDAEYSSAQYKVHVVPNSAISSIGVGTVGGGLVWMQEDYFRKPAMYMHEMGHNMLLHHAGQGGEEYGDTTGSMGYCCSTRCYNMIHMWQLGFTDYVNSGAPLPMANITSSVAVAANIASLSSGYANTGFVIQGSGVQYVISYRDSSGLDSYLPWSQTGLVYAHSWTGSSRSDAQKTLLLSSGSLGSTFAVSAGGFKVTVAKSLVSGNTAQVLICSGTDTGNPCSMSSGVTGTVTTSTSLTSTKTATATATTTRTVTATTTTATTTYVLGATSSTATSTTLTSTATTTRTATATTTASNPPPTTTTTTLTPLSFTTRWTPYFNESEVDSAVDVGAMVGIGCKGDWCGMVRAQHTSTVLVAKVNSGAVAWQEGNTPTGTLRCPPGFVGNRLRCIGKLCSQMDMMCTRVASGTVGDDGEVVSDWFPSSLGTTQDMSCPNGTLVVGMNCGGTNCAKKQLVCRPFIQGACQPACNALQLKCGSDGCGGSCGTCTATNTQCLANVGKCVTVDLVSATWTTSSRDYTLNDPLGVDNLTPMAETSAMATGFLCQERYCSKIALVLLGVRIDGSQHDFSPWISNEVGRSIWSWSAPGEATWADCPPGKAVTRVQCKGKFCVNVQFECAKPLGWTIDQKGDPWRSPDWFSEEVGMGKCPDGYVVTGMECALKKDYCLIDCNSYCDNKKLHCRQIYPETMGTANTGVLGTQEIAAGSYNTTFPTPSGGGGDGTFVNSARPRTAAAATAGLLALLVQAVSA